MDFILSSNSFIDSGVVLRIILLVGTYGHFWSVSFQPIMWHTIWAFLLSSFSLGMIKLSHDRALYLLVGNTGLGDSFEFGFIKWFWTSAVCWSTVWLWICIHKFKKLLQCLAFGCFFQHSVDNTCGRRNWSPPALKVTTNCAEGCEGFWRSKFIALILWKL